MRTRTRRPEVLLCLLPALALACALALSGCESGGANKPASAAPSPSPSPTAGARSSRSSGPSASGIEELWMEAGCGYSGPAPAGRVYGFAPDQKAEDEIKRIMDALGLVPNYQARAADVDNAVAIQDDQGQRWILYNQTFMEDVYKKAGTRWAATAILAHEIGHHLNNDPLPAAEGGEEIHGDCPSCRHAELAADKFCGKVLYLLGCEDLSEAQAAMRLLAPDHDTTTHPRKSARIAAIANGWVDARDRFGRSGPAPTPEPSPTPRPTPAPTPRPTATPTPTPVPVPGNDRFGQAFSLEGSSGRTTASSVGASSEAGEPRHAGQPGGASVWWQWTAPGSGTLEVDLSGSSFDTLLGVYQGAWLGSLREVASADDGGRGKASFTLFPVGQGATYRIAVDGYAGSAGSIVLAWRFREKAPEPTPTPTPEPTPTPTPTPTMRQPSLSPGSRVGEVRTLQLGGGVTMNLVWIEPGTFTMGSPSSEEGRDDNEGPQTRVTLTEGFWMGQSEVTQGQWKAIMGSNPSRFKGDSLPVEQVSWNDAVEFCQKLSRKTGREIGLPTEAQWEYACRAGTTGRFSFGDSDSRLGDYAWHDGNSGSQTHPVGQKRANPRGLYDMHGNVWEWCQDWHSAYPGSLRTNYSGLNSGDRRVHRGGSWGSDPRRLRSAYRNGFSPGGRNDYLGFRVRASASPG